VAQKGGGVFVKINEKIFIGLWANHYNRIGKRKKFKTKGDSKMPKQVTDVDLLSDYLQGVVGRADHHAPNVNEVALAIAGAVIWRKDDEPIEVFVREGEMKNVLWFKVGGVRYALSYNHDSGEIELREGGTQGSVVGSFSNATQNNVIRDTFDRL
jgi:hypothetical protein